jgi:hypothetical protein
LILDTTLSVFDHPVAPENGPIAPVAEATVEEPADTMRLGG